MNRLKIKLSTPEMAGDFVNVCSKYENCDINVHDKSKIIDGKSIIGIFAIERGKEVEVEMITNNKNVIPSFIDDMKRFEVKNEI